MDKDMLHQQAVMQVLGYYTGALDGVWGPKSQQAKRDWENSGQFQHAIPNGGLPFKIGSALPIGVHWDFSSHLYIDGIEQVLNPPKKEQTQSTIKLPKKDSDVESDS